MDNTRSFLVQWQNAQADYWVGEMPGGSVGSHMKGLMKGDLIFVCSCDNSEIYLMGAISVSRLGTERSGPYRGKPSAEGKHISGPFQRLPLGGLKWRIKFEKTDSPQLSRSKSLIWQVRSRRRLTSASAELLLAALKEGARKTSIEMQFAKEGSPLLRQVTTRERDPKVRAAALRKYNFTCAVCECKPAEVYGQFAKQCLDVHHLLPLAGDKENRSATKLSDVVLLCPTCHRALHMFENPGAWLKFKRRCSFLS
jgi:hypothetical protein